MKFKYQTIPPECHCCGVMSHDGCDVDVFHDLDDDPQWGNWLCPRCRSNQQAGKTPRQCENVKPRNPFVSPEDVKEARIEAAKRRGIPMLRRSPAKRPGFWRG